MNWIQILTAVLPAATTIGIVFLQTGKILNRVSNLEIRMDKFETRWTKLKDA